MRQVLGEKKHKLCEVISGIKYQICYTTRTHNYFECWIDESNADHVHTKHGYFEPTVRDGKRKDMFGEYH